MRNDLKGILGISDIETDVDLRIVSFKIISGINLESSLNRLVETNDKLKDWELIEEQ